MCGIAGLITSAGTAEELIPRVQAMMDAQSHRGPDDNGLEVIHKGMPAVAFGHLRLAIIDTSPAGHQPMHDPATGNWITFNGEIYNYRELRRDLEQQGEVFRTNSDTEVLLKAYAAWGASCTRRLRGIFAFGIWDSLARSLFLARDQLGVKPLYYWQGDGTFIFASEVRALLASGLVPRHLNLPGLHSYLAYGSVQEPLTLVQGVQSVLPGHTVTWQADKLSFKRYWHLPEPEQVSPNVPENIYEQVRERLAEAVRVQMIADVPVGAFLSGGIDSTAIAALAQRAGKQALKTFSVVFDETAYDERDYSRAAARHIGTDHTELHLTEAAVIKALPKAASAFDQPSMDGLNTYFVSKVTREAGLTVALSGVGGDELFGGYNGYHNAILADRWGHRAALFPRAVRWPLSKAIRAVSVRERLRKAADLLHNPENTYFLTRQVFAPSQVAKLVEPESLYQRESWVAPTFRGLIDETANYDPINRASALELQTYMLSTLLRDTDQMSMAHALEVRVPLLDHKLVEFLFTLPGSSKLHSKQPKSLLTFSLNGDLPDECVYRPKRGFELPFAVWLKKSLQSEVKAKFSNSSNRPAFPFRAAGLENTWKLFEQGKLGWSRVWGLYVLLNWLEQHQIVK